MQKIFILFLFFGMWGLCADDLVEYDYELDIYYTNVSAYINLDKNNEIVDGTSFSEREIYSSLLLNSFKPNIFLIEAAIHPMGIAGLYFRENNEDMYDRSKVQGFNWIKPLTAGFEEPYSIRAFIGTLVTLGNFTIKDNQAYHDAWGVLEFKLKGTRDKKDRDLDWSFRVGACVHDNHDFANTLYIGARRSSIDYKKSEWSFVHNSAFSVMLAVSADSFKLSDAKVMLEKKWPLSSWGKKVSFGLGVGYLYSGDDKYRGQLSNEGIDNHQLIFRPNLTW